MPLNYLQLEPQIRQYAQTAAALSGELRTKLDTALALLRQCGENHQEAKERIHKTMEAQADPPRCGLPRDEHADGSFPAPAKKIRDYTLLSSDGSQITPGGHDAVSIALLNTSRICYQPGSGEAPAIHIISGFLMDEDDEIEMGHLSEDLVALRRDVAEMEIIARWEGTDGLPAAAIGDGPLELFHQPRQGENFERYFSDYLAILKAIHLKDMALAGYTDRPRAALIVKMLEFFPPDGRRVDLSGLEDQSIFKQLLAPGARSAIFELRSTSSAKYEGALALHFFYLNVGSATAPWIARVEIPAWTTNDAQKVALIHQALLDQCRLMGSRPYPYLLHRAHEEAVIKFEEKERLVERLAAELQRQGLGLSLPSHKQSAKNLGPRRRIGK